jgi:hypothetical protein
MHEIDEGTSENQKNIIAGQLKIRKSEMAIRKKKIRCDFRYEIWGAME